MPTPYTYPDEGNAFAREFDTHVVSGRIGQLVHKALHASRVKGTQVAAIGVTSQRQGSVFLDREGKELYAGPNMDLRAIMEGAAIDEEMGAEVYRTTGHLPSLMFTLARTRWFRNSHPASYGRMSQVLTIAGWLAYKLTGVAACEPALAGEAGLLDVGKHRRCCDLISKLDIEASLFPPLVEAGKPVGGLKADVAKKWGLEAGIPVTLAGPDTQSGLVGMGVVESGQAELVAGWSSALQMVTAEPFWDSEMRTWVGCMPIESRWVAESNMGDGGKAYSWLVSMLFKERNAHEVAERLALQVPIGSDGAMAFLGPGPDTMPSAGMRVGALVFHTPLSFQEVSREQLARAYLENLAYSTRANLARLENVTRQKVAVVNLGGGMSRSGLFASILANVLNREVHRSMTPEVSTHGALLAAAVAAGEYSDLASAAKRGCCGFRSYQPYIAESADYEEYYGRWHKTYHALQEAV
jgi:autoinducer 2 (AI-2) kinase